MALAPDVASSTDPNPVDVHDDTPPVDAPGLQYFVMGLFFIFGGITSLNDVLIPKLKELFTLSYTEAMLVQFCFFAAYLVIGIPGAKLVKKIGYMRGAVAGLLIMMAGCLLFIPASQTATYGLFLGALFILRGSGAVQDLRELLADPVLDLFVRHRDPAGLRLLDDDLLVDHLVQGLLGHARALALRVLLDEAGVGGGDQAEEAVHAVQDLVARVLHALAVVIRNMLLGCSRHSVMMLNYTK